jgi:hypothetical protein
LHKCSENVFVSAIIADVNRAIVPALQAQRFQKPEHGFAFIPFDIGHQLKDFFTVNPAQFATSRRYFGHRPLDSRHIICVHVAIVRGNRKTFPFQLRTRNVIKRFA